MLNKFCFIFFATHIASAYSMELDCHEKARDLGGKFVALIAPSTNISIDWGEQCEIRTKQSDKLEEIFEVGIMNHASSNYVFNNDLMISILKLGEAAQECCPILFEYSWRIIETMAITSAVKGNDINMQAGLLQRCHDNSALALHMETLLKANIAQGDYFAAYLLAKAYDNANLAPIDAALFYYKKAASGGISEANCALGELYYYGDKVEFDLHQVVYYLAEACTSNNEIGIRMLNRLLSDLGKMSSNNYHDYYSLLDNEVEDTNGNRSFGLAKFFLRGYSPYQDQDLFKVLNLFVVATRKGHKLAPIYLAAMSIKNVLNEDGQKELRREFGRNEIFKQAVDTEGFVKDPWISEELGKSLAELESCLIR